MLTRNEEDINTDFMFVSLYRFVDVNKYLLVLYNITVYSEYVSYLYLY